MNMKKVFLLASFLFVGVLAYGQSANKGFSASAWGGVVVGDEDFSDSFGAAFGGNLHYTLTDSESTDFAISVGGFSLSPSSEFKDFGGSSEFFWRIYGNVIFEDALSEGQNLSLGLGYATAADSDADYNGIYAEAFYHFELSDNFSIAPGGFYVAGSDDAGNITVLSVRLTYGF